MLPARTYAASPYRDRTGPAETIGWPELRRTVVEALRRVPEGQRHGAVVFTGNYGQAGALEWYGVGPPVYSGHNGWRDWGPPPEGAGPVVVIGFRDVSDAFAGCVGAGRVRNLAGADIEDSGARVWV